MSKIFDIRNTKAIYTEPEKSNWFNTSFLWLKTYVIANLFAFIPFGLFISVVLFLPALAICIFFNLFDYQYTIWVLGTYGSLLIASATIQVENMKLYKYFWHQMTFNNKTIDLQLPKKSIDDKFFIYDDQMLLIAEVKELKDFDESARNRIETMVQNFGKVKFIVAKEPIDEVLASKMAEEYMARRKVLNNALYDMLKKSTEETLYGLDMNHIYIIIRTPLLTGRTGFMETTNNLISSYNLIRSSYPNITILTDEKIFNELI
jgi:hypothetical protein